MDSPGRPVWRSRAWIGAGPALLAIVLALGVVGVGGRVGAVIAVSIAIAAALVVIVIAIRRTRRQRREYEQSLTRWAGERAAQEERLRIARELHDLASHGLGLITVRAAAARTGAADAEERDRALADIEDAGRAATSELRRMLSVLRSPDERGDGGEGGALRPARSLKDLPDVVRDAAATGTRVSLVVEPGLELPAGVQAAVYAIVREGVMNVVRHAGPVGAEARIAGQGASVRVTVMDEGPDPDFVAQPGAGHGLAGLRERVGALGGRMSAGVRAQGRGFCLEVVLPKGEGR